MRKIALMAVAFAVLTAGVANIHMASAQATQYSNTDTQQNTQSVTQQDPQPAAPAPAPAPAVPADTVVTVQDGDTLSGIAANNGTDYMRLFNANDFINNPDLIFPGDQIRVPANDEQLAQRTVPTPVIQAAQPVVAQASAPVAAPADTVVTVQDGDTLDSIAANNGTTYMRLFNANPSIANPDVLSVGDQIRIPASDEQLSDRALPAAPAAVEPAAAAPVAAPAPVVEAPVVAAPAPVAAPVVFAADNSAKAYIYFHESTNNPDATNYLGCYGLGQDCSGQLRTLCGADYACQDEFFNNYAMNRYGSWANALAFWQSHQWW